MMKNKKLSRFLSFIFAIVMVVGLLPSMSLRAAAADAMPTSGTVTLAAGKTYPYSELYYCVRYGNRACSGKCQCYGQRRF